MVRCKAKIKTAGGDTIRCEKYKSPHNGEHSVDGYFWSGARNGPWPWRRAGLWLTNGGRIVKPGPGEHASEEGHDILLMTADELQSGIFAREFLKRLNAARKKWNKRKWNRGDRI